MGFIRKVYGILLTQLSFTALGAIISVEYQGFRGFIEENIILYLVAYILFFTGVITLACSQSIARKVPLNFFFLSLVTIGLTYVV